MSKKGMIKMIGKFMKVIQNENGAVSIVEASIVFPVMFIVLFFLIFMGNMFFVQAQVEAVVQTNAIRGATLCSDPLLEYVEEQGNYPSPGDLSVKPYRYIFGGMNDIETKVEKSVKADLESSNSTFFKNMQPKIRNKGKGKIAKYNNFVLYSTFSVEVDYTITLPISFFGSEKLKVADMSARAEVAVNDTPEFIRNTDMVVDMFSGTKLGNKIQDVFNKINSFLSDIGGKEG